MDRLQSCPHCKLKVSHLLCLNCGARLKAKPKGVPTRSCMAHFLKNCKGTKKDRHALNQELRHLPASRGSAGHGVPEKKLNILLREGWVKIVLCACYAKEKRWSQPHSRHIEACHHEVGSLAQPSPQSEWKRRFTQEALARGMKLHEWVVCSHIQVTPDVHFRAAVDGNIPLLQYLPDSIQLGARIAALAGAVGQIGVLQWLRQNGVPLVDKVIYGAIRRGDVNMVKWALANGCMVHQDTLLATVKEVFSYHSYICERERLLSKWTNKVHIDPVEVCLDVPDLSAMKHCTSVAAVGEMGAVKWCRDLGWDWDEGTCSWAARRGHTELVLWLIGAGCPIDVNTVGLAAAGGHMDLVRRLVEEENVIWDNTACFGAASNGHLVLLQWLAERKEASLSTDVMIFAAKEGHVHVMEWLKAEGCPLIPQVCEAAAQRGQIVALTWLLENGCPVDEESCSAAATGGHLDALLCLKAFGCPWGASTCTSAAEAGHEQLLKWAFEHDCPVEARTMSCAAERGDLDLMIWLRENGCPWNEETFVWAAKGGHLEVLHWLQENRCPWNANAYYWPYLRKQEELLLWLLACKCPLPEPFDLDNYLLMGTSCSN